MEVFHKVDVEPVHSSRPLPSLSTGAILSIHAKHYAAVPPGAVCGYPPCAGTNGKRRLCCVAQCSPCAAYPVVELRRRPAGTSREAGADGVSPRPTLSFSLCKTAVLTRKQVQMPSGHGRARFASLHSSAPKLFRERTSDAQ
jgi:hypothetical protein